MARSKFKDFSRFEDEGAKGLVLSKEDIVYTDVARVTGITQDGRDYLSGAANFCKAQRAYIARTLKKRDIKKPAFMEKFGLSSREFNTIRILGDGKILSAIECSKLALQTKQRQLSNTYSRYGRECSHEPGEKELTRKERGFLKKAVRLRKEIAILEKRVIRPAIHFGKAIYQNQMSFKSQEEFRKAYRKERASTIGCVGSKDETGGNSTLQIRPREELLGFIHFDILSSKKVLCSFKLKKRDSERLCEIISKNSLPFTFERKRQIFQTKSDLKEGQHGPTNRPLHYGGDDYVLRKNTGHRTSLTIIFHQNDGRWTVHVSYSVPSQVMTGSQTKLLGVDTNTDSLALVLAELKGGKPSIKLRKKLHFQRSTSSTLRTTQLYAYVNEIVALAKSENATIVLENLDFEGAKRVAGKLGRLLHGIPYKKILSIFMRRCQENGVTLKLVWPAYTSILGAKFSEIFPFLGRDEASALVIALKGSALGAAYLEEIAISSLAKECMTLRINAKNNFGHSVKVTLPERQLDISDEPIPKAITVLSRLCRETIRSVKKEHCRCKKRNIPLSRNWSATISASEKWAVKPVPQNKRAGAITRPSEQSTGKSTQLNFEQV